MQMRLHGSAAIVIVQCMELGRQYNHQGLHWPSICCAEALAVSFPVQTLVDWLIDVSQCGLLACMLALD
jgi:hypothetical protein